MEDTTPLPDLDQGTEPEVTTVVPGAAAADADLPETDLDPDAPEGETPEPDKPKLSGKEKRISELTYHRRQAERREADAKTEAAYWRGIAEGRTPQGQGQQGQQQPDGPPKQESYQTYDDYLRALTRHEIGAELAQERRRASKEAETSYAEARQQEVHAGFAQRAEAFRETTPEFDYQGLAQDPDLAISTHMADAIHNLDDGPAILQHLSNNRKDAQRIYGLPPARQIYELAAISHRLANPPAPKPRPASAAPPPIKPVTGAAKAVEGLTDGLPIGEWMRRREKDASKQR